MNDRTNRTFICSIAFLDIVDYSQRVAREQLQLKERFNQLIGEVIKDIAQNDRVVIDTGDGAALCFLGDPEDALFVVMNLRDRLRTPENEALGLQIRIGINLGPVRLIHDINNHPNVLGDGINVAARVMSFAEPNQIMVSRSYFEVVSRLSQEYTRLFNYAGARTDKHVREHEVYEVGPSKEELASAAAAAATVAAPSPAAASTDAPAPPQSAAPAPAAAPKALASTAEAPVVKRNKWLVPGAIAAAVLVALAVFLGMPKSDKVSETAKADATAVPAADVKSDKAAIAETRADPAAASTATTAGGSTAAATGSTPGAAPGQEPAPAAAAGSASGAKSAAAAKAEADAAATADLMAKGLIPKGKGTDPSTAKGKDTDPLAAKGKGSDPLAAKGKGTDPLAAKGKGVDALDPTKAAPTLAADKSATKTADTAAATRKAEPAKASNGAKAAATAGTGTGTLEFWIQPFGDVVIDGKQVGSSPPLKVYKVPTGTHKIEIHNTTASFPHVVTVDVKENQVVRINKVFREY